MNDRLIKYFFEENLFMTLICIFFILVVIAMAVIFATAWVKRLKRRFSCEHEPECMRSWGVCMGCLDYKNKKGEQKK